MATEKVVLEGEVLRDHHEDGTAYALVDGIDAGEYLLKRQGRRVRLTIEVLGLPLEEKEGEEE